MRIRHLLLLAPLVLATFLGACSCSGDDSGPETDTGTIVVRMTPDGFAAHWQLQGPGTVAADGWRDTTLADMLVGDYVMDWADVNGYFAIPNSGGTLRADGELTLSAAYVLDPTVPATVTIDVTPDILPLAWVLKVQTGGGVYDVSGSGDRTVTDLPPGPITIDWQPFPDYVTPHDGALDHTLINGEVFLAEGEYVQRAPMAIEMIAVTAGTFVMGSPEWEIGYSLGGDPLRPDDEAPQHDVALTRDLLASATEITQRQYRDVVGSDPSGHGPVDNMPVENVSWFEAVSFCNALSAAEALTPAYVIVGDAVSWDPEAEGYRLPTEAEWEYLCRGDRPEAFAFGDYTGGDDPVLDRLGWYERNAGGDTTQPVASKLPNAYGLYDMHGNVEEWCWDRYGLEWYDDSPDTDPTGPQVGDERVARGGHYDLEADGCRSAVRGKAGPNLSAPSRGFRVVRNAP